MRPTGDVELSAEPLQTRLLASGEDGDLSVSDSLQFREVEFGGDSAGADDSDSDGVHTVAPRIGLVTPDLRLVDLAFPPR